MTDQTGSLSFPHLRADFSDVDALCAAVQNWDLNFLPLGWPTNEDFTGRIVQLKTSVAEFGHARLSANFQQHGAPPPGCVTFVVLDDTMDRLWWRGHDVDNRDVLVFPLGSELHSVSSSDFSIYTVSVSEAFCERVGANKFSRQPRLRSLPDVFRPPAHITASLRGSLRRQLGGSLAPLTAREMKTIAETLVLGWMEAGTGPNPKRPTGRVRELAMRKSLQRLEHSDWAELTPGELCAHAGVSERTLQYAFRDRFGLTPAVFLKARRLAAVRSLLLTSDEYGTNVGDAAAQFGFWHSGQFAADYCQAFGELPSATLRIS